MALLHTYFPIKFASPVVFRFSFGVHRERTNGRFSVTRRGLPRTCWRRVKSGTGSFDRRRCTARDGPLSRHSEKISIDHVVGANMASSEIVEYAAARSNVAGIVSFSNLINRANIPLYCIEIAHAITLLLLSERYAILIRILAYIPIYKRGL